jgi:hypothetical protein
MVYLKSNTLQILQGIQGLSFLVILHCYLTSTPVKLKGECGGKCGQRVMEVSVSSSANSGELRREERLCWRMIQGLCIWRIVCLRCYIILVFPIVSCLTFSNSWIPLSQLPQPSSPSRSKGVSYFKYANTAFSEGSKLEMLQFLLPPFLEVIVLCLIAVSNCASRFSSVSVSLKIRWRHQKSLLIGREQFVTGTVFRQITDSPIKREAVWASLLTKQI